MNKRIEVKQDIENIMHLDARNFYESALVLKQNPKHYSESPYYALLALSIELLFKSIGVVHSYEIDSDNNNAVTNRKVNHVKGHSLIEIHKEHKNKNPHITEFLSASYQKQFDRDFENDLELHANVFVQRRYTYPFNGKISDNWLDSINPSTLEDIAGFLYAQTNLLAKKQAGQI